MISNVEPSVSLPNGPTDPEFQEAGPPPVVNARDRLRAAYARQGEERRLFLRESDRDRFWYGVRIAMACVGGAIFGAIPMAWALHTTDVDRAQLAWAAGPVIGQSIVLIALMVGWRRWTDEGW